MTSLLLTGGTYLLSYIGQNILMEGLSGTSKKLYSQFEKWF